MALFFCTKRVLLRKNNFLLNRKVHGYIVLIPEIGEEISEKSSLLRNDGLPEFNTFTIEKCIASISKYTADYEKGVRNIEQTSEKVENVFTEIFTPLEHLDCPLELTWGLAKTLYLGNSTLMPTKTYMHIHERAHRAITTKFNSVPIYKAVLKAQNEQKSLTEEESRLLKKYATEGQLNGLNLDYKKRLQLAELVKAIAIKRTEFRQKVDNSIKSFYYNIDDANIVRDFPPQLLKYMSTNPKDPSLGPWRATLAPNIYQDFLENCPNKSMRWNVWQAYVRRASGYVDKNSENSTVLEKIRQNRNDQAKILGFDSFADMSMETKMAGSVDNVKKTLNKLLERSRPIQDVEIENLEIFAKQNGFQGAFEHSDVPYWKMQQRKALFHFDEETIREYFPLPVVIHGLFDLCSKLFEIKILERSDVDTWHKDVKYYEIYDADSPSPIAGFYLDPYAREIEKNKIPDNTGWMLTVRNHSSITETRPLASLIFNFQVPLYGKPSLLSFHEVKILFQKFGHALRHLLTEVNYTDVAGISNVEWDAADVCGYVMTHWLHEPKVLKLISSHYTTQEHIPDNIIHSILNVRKHMTGFELCQELYLSNLDLHLHSNQTFWRDIVRELWPTYHTIPYQKEDAHPCSFTKIFADEWAAAYYSQIWSQMIAADIYSAFYEAHNDENVLLEVGRRYRDTFLASGGSCDSNEMFRRFRGRDPSHKALLHTLGLIKSANLPPVETK